MLLPQIYLFHFEPFGALIICNGEPCIVMLCFLEIKRGTFSLKNTFLFAGVVALMYFGVCIANQSVGLKLDIMIIYPIS